MRSAALAGIEEKHLSLTASDLARIFERMCVRCPCIDRLAILEEGPTVQIVDPYAEHAREFARLLAPSREDSEANDQVVLAMSDAKS